MSRGGWRKRASDDDGWGGRGGYMAAKVCKLEDQFKLEAPWEKQKEKKGSNIFSGVAIYVNGFTDPTADELRRLMMLHGGQFHVYYCRSRTTHIVATNLPNSKVQELRGEKVVRPEWITDSVKAGRLLSYLQYQLYAKQRGLNFPSMCTGQGQESSGPSPSHHPPGHAPSVTNHGANQELDFRVNGSSRNWLDQATRPKLNGVQAEDTEPSSLEWTLTNGHCRALNGALKPLDLALHSGRIPLSDCPRLPGTLPGPNLKPVVLTSTPQVTSCPKLPAPQPVTHQQPGPRAPPTVQRPVPQPTANQTVTVPHQQNRTPEKHTPHTATTPPPGTGRVRLNGAHHPLPVRGTWDPAHSPGKVRAQNTEASIISEFYSRSRLHHISSWRSEFSEYVNSLQHRCLTGGGADFPGKERLRRQRAAPGTVPSGPQTRQPCVLHVDMDCFFVSVGIRNRPDLKGKPVAVTSNRGPGLVAQRPGADPQLELQYYQRRHKRGRSDEREADLEMTPTQESPDAPGEGVTQDLAVLSMAEIASCSYEARQVGVRNGMFFGQAKQLCPGLQSVPYDFLAYKKVALAMYETLASYTHSIEALSCDEALVDATSLLAELGLSPDDLAATIRADVREKTGCSASVGMGSNILLARMATRKAKPDGQYYLKSDEVDDFIRDQSVTSLPGVGRSMGCKLASMGVQTCGDLQQVSMSRLQKEFGPRTGQTLFRFCRGLDDRPVRSEKERKSVSADMNYGIRFTEVAEAEAFLTNLSLEIQRRLQAAGLKGRRLTLKVMVRKPGAPVEPAKFGGHGICDNLARTVTLEQSTDSAALIASEVIQLFHSMKLKVSDMRGVGMQVQQLSRAHTGPCDLSDPTAPRSRSIKDMLLARRPAESRPPPTEPDPTGKGPPVRVTPPTAPPSPIPAEPVPGTSEGDPPPKYNGGLHTPRHPRARLNLSIEVPSPSQIDRSVLEALPAELREQVEQFWSGKEQLEEQPPPAQSLGTLILQVPEQQGQTSPAGIVLALPDFSQVDPEVFAALPQELQDELQSAYGSRENAHPQSIMVPRNPLLQLKPPVAGRTKRRYKRKNMSPVRNGPSPLKNRLPGNGPAKSSSAQLLPHALKLENSRPDTLKFESGASTSSLKPDVQEKLVKHTARPGPTLAGACKFTDIRTLLREWVTTIPEPMEEDILQVVKYCTELIEDRDLEKLDLVIKYMKRLMQQSAESVWNMAFDFILDNVQVVVQQTYGSTLKIT